MCNVIKKKYWKLLGYKFLEAFQPFTIGTFNFPSLEDPNYYYLNRSLNQSFQ